MLEVQLKKGKKKKYLAKKPQTAKFGAVAE